MCWWRGRHLLLLLLQRQEPPCPLVLNTGLVELAAINSRFYHQCHHSCCGNTSRHCCGRNIGRRQLQLRPPARFSPLASIVLHLQTFSQNPSVWKAVSRPLTPIKKKLFCSKNCLIGGNTWRKKCDNFFMFFFVSFFSWWCLRRLLFNKVLHWYHKSFLSFVSFILTYARPAFHACAPARLAQWTKCALSLKFFFCSHKSALDAHLQPVMQPEKTGSKSLKGHKIA